MTYFNFNLKIVLINSCSAIYLLYCRHALSINVFTVYANLIAACFFCHGRRIWLLNVCFGHVLYFFCCCDFVVEPLHLLYLWYCKLRHFRDLKWPCCNRCWHLKSHFDGGFASFRSIYWLVLRLESWRRCPYNRIGLKLYLVDFLIEDKVAFFLKLWFKLVFKNVTSRCILSGFVDAIHWISLERSLTVKCITISVRLCLLHASVNFLGRIIHLKVWW